jgi:hypothetical protein
MAVFFAYCRIVATDIHFIAGMRYRRGRPDKASRCGNSVKCYPEKTLFADRRSQSAGGPPDRFRRGRPVKASRYALRAYRSVVVSLNLSRRNAASESEKKAWLVKPCLMDLLCISSFIRGGPPFGTAPTQAPVGAFLRAEGYSKRCCQFESVAAQRHLSPSELLTADG